MRKQYQRNRGRFQQAPDTMPVFGTMASRFNDDGVTALYQAMLPRLRGAGPQARAPGKLPPAGGQGFHPAAAPSCRRSACAIWRRSPRRCATTTGFIAAQARTARERQSLQHREELVRARGQGRRDFDELIAAKSAELSPASAKLLEQWPKTRELYAQHEYVVKIRDKEIRTQLTTSRCRARKIRKVSLPRFEDDGEMLRFLMKENVPGSFPYTAGVFAFKREGEDPTRMFAGEGDAFTHQPALQAAVSEGMPAHRLSTAFDSVTCTARIPIRARTSTARSAIPAFRSPRSTT